MGYFDGDAGIETLAGVPNPRCKSRQMGFNAGREQARILGQSAANAVVQEKTGDTKRGPHRMAMDGGDF